jgi:hypothetical protein
MNSKEKALSRVMFHARVAKSVGMSFQNLFSDIMRYARPDFTPVKPQGNQGDWKNDGHEPKAGRYYQVYAPEQFDEATAIKKLHEDFTGLLAKWGDTAVYPNGVKEFYFVINDAFRVTPGAYPTTVATLEKLRQLHGLNECKPFLSKDLEDILLDLPADKIIAVLGNPPNPADISVLSFDLVNEVIRHIVENTGPRSLSKTLVAPDFDEKIVFNKLKATGYLLRDATYRRGSLEDYFCSNSEFTRQEVRDRLQELYDESKILIFTDGPDGPTPSDQQLFHILDEITPKTQKNDQRLATELQNAALVIMAYFFEACDIFEEPPQC